MLLLIRNVKSLTNTVVEECPAWVHSSLLWSATAPHTWQRDSARWNYICDLRRGESPGWDLSVSQGGRDVAIVEGTEKELVNRPVLESLEGN